MAKRRNILDDLQGHVLLSKTKFENKPLRVLVGSARYEDDLEVLLTSEGVSDQGRWAQIELRLSAAQADELAQMLEQMAGHVDKANAPKGKKK